MTACDLLITRARVLTCDAAGQVIPEGWVAVQGGRILALGGTAETAPADTAERLDAAGRILLPGLVNAHTHLPMTLFRGLADDLPLERWLHDFIFPAERLIIDPETVYAGALLGCAELALSGTTSCCDGYFFADAVAEAVLASGLRAVIGQGVIDHPAPGVPDPAGNLAAAEAFCDRWQGRSPRIHPSVFCHAPYSCSAETLSGAKRLCRERGLLFQVHAAETRRERQESLERHGLTPIAFLDRAGVLDGKTLLHHAVWVDEADLTVIAGSGSAVSHNPESNLKLASGIAPLPEMLARGIPVGLGTDGSASNNDLDLFGAMDLAAKIHKAARLDPTAVSAAQALALATRGGARALGLAAEIGSIEPGKLADLVLLETRLPHLTPLHDPVSAVVYAARGADVHTVLVGGRRIVEGGRLLSFDLAAAMARVEETAGRIRRRLPLRRSRRS
ncbi:MAG: amidohydrolase [Desulfobacterales bacterium]